MHLDVYKTAFSNITEIRILVAPSGKIGVKYIVVYFAEIRDKIIRDNAMVETSYLHTISSRNWFKDPNYSHFLSAK